MQWSLVEQLANSLVYMYPQYYGNMSCSMLYYSASCARPTGCPQTSTASQLVPHPTQLLHLAHWRPFAQSQPPVQSLHSHKGNFRTHAFVAETREVPNTDKVRSDYSLVVHLTQAIDVLAKETDVTTLALVASPSVFRAALKCFV